MVNKVILTLDSVGVNSFLLSAQTSDFNKKEIAQFYKRRNYQFAWLSEDGFNEVAINFYSQYEAYLTDFKDSSAFNLKLKTLANQLLDDSETFLKSNTDVVLLELLFTQLYFEYAPKVNSGKFKNPQNLHWYIPQKHQNYQLLLDSLVASVQNKDILEPENSYYVALKVQLKIYRQIEIKGAWPTINSFPPKGFKVFDLDSCIKNTKKSLYILGDFKSIDTSFVFTQELSLAITKFQGRMGLAEDGKLGAATVNAINIPLKMRILQIMLNLERLRWLPAKIEPNFVLINIPAFSIYVFENQKLAWSSKVIVGEAMHQTNIFKGAINNVVLNPYWVVPVSIIKNEMVQKAQIDPQYFKRNHLEILAGDKIISPSKINWVHYKKNYTIRQKPGNDNALGRYKFMTYNSFSIYLHDTPVKELFANNQRAFSHGCIRLAEPQKLALYLLRNNKYWNEARIQKMINTNKETYIPLNYSLPVYIVYFTAWVNNEGQLNFRNDIYGRDKKLGKEIFGN